MTIGPVPKNMHALIQKHDGFADRGNSELKPYGELLELAEVPVPAPRPGQVLVRVRLGSVNPSDVMFVNGYYGQPREKGKPAGFEGIGEVVASGGGFMANRLKGRRVAFAARRGGSWSEYAVADAVTAIPLRKDIRDEDGAAMIVNPLTAYAMFGIVREEGAKAFIMSAAASQLCKLLVGLSKDNGFRAISLVRRDDQIAPLKTLGAAHVLNITDPDFDRQLAEVIRQEKPRIFLDAVTGPLASKVFDAMGNRARWIVYGRLDPSETVIREAGQLIFQSKRVEGFWLTQWLQDSSLLAKMRAVNAVQKRFANGEWQTDVTAHLPLGEALEKLEAALAVPNGKVFITPKNRE